MPSIREDFEDDEFYFQQYGAPPYYHRDVGSFLDKILLMRWIGRRDFIGYPLCSPDLTQLDLFMGYLKDRVYAMKPAIIDNESSH